MKSVILKQTNMNSHLEKKKKNCHFQIFIIEILMKQFLNLVPLNH